MIACGAGAGVMNRTKWMRLAVRDLGDVIRWAGAQNAREIGEFRYRVVNGREIVSFRLVPRYAIDIGAREIIVLAYARAIGWRAWMRDLRRIAGAAMRRGQRPRGGTDSVAPHAASACPQHTPPAAARPRRPPGVRGRGPWAQSKRQAPAIRSPAPRSFAATRSPRRI